MKRVLMTMMAVMTLTMAKSQVTPMVLGENHAMVRVTKDAKYLLLPVQEKRGERDHCGAQ